MLSKTRLLKINKVALRGMGYSGAMYALDPADPVKDGFSWVETHFTPRSAGPTTLVHHIVFHVAVVRQSASGK